MHPNLNVASGCIFKLGESLIGINCAYAYQQAVEIALTSINSRALPVLDTKDQIRKFFQSLYDLRKNQFQLLPTQQPGAFETSPMNALVVNRAGIFKVDATRAVYEFTRYWAIGSGEAFALGALLSTYDANSSGTYSPSRMCRI